MGTPAYMSPEQCLGRKADARSDLYQAGVLLFQMIAGRLPFTGAFPMEILTAQIREQAPPLGSIVPGIAPELEAMVQKAMAKALEDRFATADEMRAELARVASLKWTRAAGGRTTRPKCGELPPPVATAPPRASRSGMLVSAAGAVVLVAAMLFAPRGQPPRDSQTVSNLMLARRGHRSGSMATSADQNQTERPQSTPCPTLLSPVLGGHEAARKRERQAGTAEHIIHDGQRDSASAPARKSLASQSPQRRPARKILLIIRDGDYGDLALMLEKEIGVMKMMLREAGFDVVGA